MRIVLEECGYNLGSGKNKIKGDCGKCKARWSQKPKLVSDPTQDPDPDNSSDSEDDDDAPADCCLRRMLAMQSDFRNQKSLLEIVSMVWMFFPMMI